MQVWQNKAVWIKKKTLFDFQSYTFLIKHTEVSGFDVTESEKVQRGVSTSENNMKSGLQPF